MTRTTDKKKDTEISDVFLRLSVRGYVDQEENLDLDFAEDMHKSVFEIFGDMARDGMVHGDKHFDKTHFSYILFRSGSFISQFADKESELRNKIDWMSEIDCHIEPTRVTKEELEQMEFYKQDISFDALFDLADEVQDN